MIKAFKDLCKMGLVYFVQITTACGYFLSLEVETAFSWLHFIGALVGVSLITMGSFALNQWQEADLDARMKRTQSRPIPAGLISKQNAFIISALLMLLGTPILWWASPASTLICWLTVILYNGLYTVIWKPKWTFGAVPGAIPGAMPVVIGYAANTSDIFHKESVYLFLIMFLWQMPHFWALAIKYQEDYKKGNIPVLPSVLGDYTTIFHMGIYLFLYVALALAAPLFVPVRYTYAILVLPFSIIVLWQFLKFARTQGKENWLAFFLWINFSMLAYLIAPVLDKWYFILWRDGSLL
jgi:protoheme IX farnesyltransferase